MSKFFKDEDDYELWARGPRQQAQGQNRSGGETGATAVDIGSSSGGQIHPARSHDSDIPVIRYFGTGVERHRRQVIVWVLAIFVCILVLVSFSDPFTTTHRPQLSPSPGRTSIHFDRDKFGG